MRKGAALLVLSTSSFRSGLVATRAGLRTGRGHCPVAGADENRAALQTFLG